MINRCSHAAYSGCRGCVTANAIAPGAGSGEGIVPVVGVSLRPVVFPKDVAKYDNNKYKCQHSNHYANGSAGRTRGLSYNYIYTLIIA